MAVRRGTGHAGRCPGQVAAPAAAWRQSMSIDVPRTEDEHAALAEAERGPSPFVVLRDDGGRQLIVPLDGDRPRTIGRRLEADIALPWDRQVSRLHAELRRLAGEWTIVD